jgi:hypothetical protein
MDYFALLSDELIVEVFKNLDANELARSALLSKRICKIADDDTLWRQFSVDVADTNDRFYYMITQYAQQKKHKRLFIFYSFYWQYFQQSEDNRPTISNKWLNSLVSWITIIIARLVTAPLETVGVIQQTGVAQLEDGTVKTFQSLVEREGWLALFKGESLVALRTANVLLTPILSYIANLFNFDTSVLSGLIIFPINLIQTRLVVQPFDNRRYSGFTDAVYKIVSAQGLKGLWRGISFTLSVLVPLTVVSNFLWILIKKNLASNQIFSSRMGAVMFLNLLKMYFACIAYPQDTLVKQFQTSAFDLPPNYFQPRWKLNSYGDFFKKLLYPFKVDLWRGILLHVIRSMVQGIVIHRVYAIFPWIMRKWKSYSLQRELKQFLDKGYADL